MSPNKKGFLEYLKIHGKDKSWQKLAEQFNYKDESSTRKTATKLNTEDYKNIIKTRDELLQEIDEFEQKTNNEKGTSSVKWISTKEALTEEEIYKECHMDPNKWILTQIWHKKRSAGFIYSADFKLKLSNHVDNVQNEIEHLLETYKSKYKPLVKDQLVINDSYTSPNMIFISLTDLHLDKATNDNLSIEVKIKNYQNILEKLLYRAYKNCFIDEIVYVTGNDIFNTDCYFQTTTNGTPQTNNTTWNDAYERIFDMQVQAISKLKQFCNKLHIIHCPSNHDLTKGFYLAHALEVYFKGDKDITFDRTAEYTKVYTYGVNFLGVHHGDTQVEKLPLYFASKYGKQWGSTRYREIALGDKHFKKSWQLKLNVSENEMEGVRMFMTPSLGGFGQWDKRNLYDNTRQTGIVRYYSKDFGYAGEYEESIH